jgi:pyruvate/2-oxoglutarate/acetoin dehydrogenase E1 component
MSQFKGQITYREAINLALRELMRNNPKVVVLGEDVGAAGGVFKVTDGLQAEFGAERVMDTPISETGFIGASIGLALGGYKPIAELMFADFAGVAFDQIVNQAAKYLYLSAGQMPVPLVIRTVGGAGLGFAAQHSQTTESWYTAIPGLKVVVPATPQDAYELLFAAVDDPNPVIYIEHKKLYTYQGELNTEVASKSKDIIGVAKIEKEGSDVTIVASLAMVWEALAAAQQLEQTGIGAEVINIRSILPMDVNTVIQSIKKTGRLIVVEEQPLSGGWSGVLVAEVVERALDYLDAPPRRIGLPHAPVPFSKPLEERAVPCAQTIARMAEEIMG